MIEINIGIWCASSPALKALFSKAQRARTQHSLSHGYQYHSSERSGLSEVGGGKKLASSGNVSMGKIVKNEEFVMEDMVASHASRSRERVYAMGRERA
jgi:hypothetical protein